MTDLFTEASYDHEGLARVAALAQAEAGLGELFPFFAQSRSWRDYTHRRALAAGQLTAIAARSGVGLADVCDLADSHMVLYVEAMTKAALPEGADPLQAVTDASRPQGAGPAKGYEHDEGPDFSGGYAEIPQGPPGGPSPAVTQMVYEKPQPVQEAVGRRTGAAKSCPSCSCSMTSKGKCRGCKTRGGCTCTPGDPCGGTKAMKQGSLRHTAQDPGNRAAGQPSMSSQLPAGVGPGMAGGSSGTPDGTMQGGFAPMVAPPGSNPRGQASPGDQVNQQVTAVATSIALTNPALPESECRRVARRVVGGYLRQADLEGSVIGDQPIGGDSEGGGGGGMTGWEKYRATRGLIDKLPDVGAEAGEAAELAAL